MLNKRGKNMSGNYTTTITIQYKDTNDPLDLTFNNDKAARTVFHYAVSDNGLENVSIRKEWH